MAVVKNGVEESPAIPSIDGGVPDLPLGRLAAIAVASIDERAWSSLTLYRESYREAKLAGDQESMSYLLDAIEETLGRVSRRRPVRVVEDMDDEAMRGINEAADRHRAEFFRRYRRARDASPYRTLKEIAERAGISETTLHAIEAERVKPQMGTIKKLATCFGVEMHELTGD